MMTLALGACGQRDASPESGQNIGIPLTGAERSAGGVGSAENLAAGSLSTPGAVQALEGSTVDGASDAGDGVQGNVPASILDADSGEQGSSPEGSTPVSISDAGEGVQGNTSASVPNTGNGVQSGGTLDSTSAGALNAGNGVQGSGTLDSTSAGALNAGNEIQGDGQVNSAQADTSAGGGSVDSGLLQPTYIGSWKVTEYCYPSTPCGLSQMEVDVLIGSELVYAPESFTCNQKVIDGEEFGYEFSFYDSLSEIEQEYNVSVSGWFAEADTGKVKSGYLTIEEGIFGDSFSYMEEQPDKMLIYYYGVMFLAVRE